MLIYLLRSGAPQIELRDEQESVDVTALFRELSASADERAFAIKGHTLNIRTFRLYRTGDATHRLHLCAEEREVISEPLSNTIPDLSRKLIDENNAKFVVSSYVSGAILDQNVTPDRINFALPPTTPFYCYVVADDTPKLQKWARYYGLTVTPDAGGYFGYNKDVGSYLEVISYQKLLADARKRNRILFDKLQLPDRIL